VECKICGFVPLAIMYGNVWGRFLMITMIVIALWPMGATAIPTVVIFFLNTLWVKDRDFHIERNAISWNYSMLG